MRRNTDKRSIRVLSHPCIEHPFCFRLVQVSFHARLGTISHENRLSLRLCVSAGAICKSGAYGRGVIESRPYRPFYHGRAGQTSDFFANNPQPACIESSFGLSYPQRHTTPVRFHRNFYVLPPIPFGWPAASRQQNCANCVA